ncbi:MAG: VTT domain-containing protein, partial [bacterium]
MSETQTLIQHLGALSYIGIFGVSIIANVIVPVPEEIVLLALGFLVGTGQVNGYAIIGILIAGLFISDISMYYFAKKGFRFVTFFYEKFFAKRLASKREWLESHVTEVIFFSRFMVQLRFLGPFLAGQTQTPTKTFVKYNLYALTVYVPFYILVGFYFHNRIEVISSGIGIAR